MDIDIRPVAAADARTCGRILYDAFREVAVRHGFPPDFASVDVATQVATYLINHPFFYGVVAESRGRIIGSNFVSERDAIRSVGPLSVDPAVQARGAGRRLMEAVLERAAGAPGVRLVQDAFNTASLSLYASLGFEVREPLAVLTGRPLSRGPTERQVREMGDADLDECARLCRQVHGLERTRELRDALRGFAPFVLERDGRIAAYATTLSVWQVAHGVGETEADLCALIAGVGRRLAEPLAFPLPTREAAIFRWCLAEGMRVIKPMTLMSIGEYQEPRGCYFPSVAY